MARDLVSLLLAAALGAGCGGTTLLMPSTDAPTDAPTDPETDAPTDAPTDGSTTDLTEPTVATDAAIDAADAASSVDAPMDHPPVDAPSDVTVTPPPVDAPVTPPPVDVPVTPPPLPSVPGCLATDVRGEVGATCSGIDQAYTARGVNAGYYAFRVLRPVVQFSGDHDGDGTTVFSAGPRRRGVVLQTIPAGAYVGLSTIPGNYNPPTGCDVATCGNPSRAACGDNSPALRAPVAGFYWGYGYQGASHMQGWISAPAGALEFAGYDAGHPCALGPAGLDYEAHAACGRPTACRGANPTCGAVNHCDEGGDDCGRTQCGAMSGGPLTPSAWRRAVTRPAGHVCTMHDPPNAAVRCLDNGPQRDAFFVYPFGAYVYWAQNSTTRAWIHYGDQVQVYFHNRDAQGVLWDFIEVLSTGAPTLTPASDGAGAGGGCSDARPENCHPCRNGGTCGWVQDVFVGG